MGISKSISFLITTWKSCITKNDRTDIQMTDEELEEYFRSGKDYLSSLSPEERKAFRTQSDFLP